jgi:protein-disulfide isomerase
MKSHSVSVHLSPLSRLAVVTLAALVAYSGSSSAQDKPKPAAAPVKSPAKAPAKPPAAADQKAGTNANVKGPADAPIKVVEFADFMCPGCRAMSTALRSYFAQQGPDINLTFKNFPLEQTCNPGIGRSIHNGACELARGAICASELGAFWPYHDRIFSRAWEVATRQDVIDNGVAVGMNKAKLEACLAAPETNSKLSIQIKEGFEVKVEITPTLVVNGKKLAETIQFYDKVEEERKKLAAAKAK